MIGLKNLLFPGIGFEDILVNGTPPVTADFVNELTPGTTPTRVVFKRAYSSISVR